MSFLGCLLIFVCGIVLALLLSSIPVGYSDEDMATIGRKFYYGLPFPYYTASRETSLGSLGVLIKRLATFQTFTLTLDGTFRIDKFDHWAERNTLGMV